MPARNNDEEETVLFADDIAHIATYEKNTPPTLKVQTYLLELEAWMNKWRLKLQMCPNYFQPWQNFIGRLFKNHLVQRSNTL